MQVGTAWVGRDFEQEELAEEPVEHDLLAFVGVRGRFLGA